MSALVYLASPYTHQSPLVRAQRFDAACKAAGRLMCAGACVYSPIAHGHAIETAYEPVAGRDHDFWLRQCFAILLRSSRLVVLTLDGWEQSRGIAAEIEYARANGIPLEFMSP
jgi:hypothetical protein